MEKYKGSLGFVGDADDRRQLSPAVFCRWPNTFSQDLCRRRSAVEPYEISRYGTLLAWTEELGLDDAAELLKQTWKRRKRPMRR
jgi:hypothetical protein